jgi:hypothetical protein
MEKDMRATLASRSGWARRGLLALVIVVAMIVGQPAANPGVSRSAKADPGYVTYLPLVIYSSRVPSIFGIESGTLEDAQGLQQVSGSGAYFSRQTGLSWAELQPSEGYTPQANTDSDWSSVSWLDESLVNASNRGMQVIVVVRGTPSWALGPSGKTCGPIASDKLAAFGEFMYQLVLRYSQPPYNGMYYEIWNEPDYAQQDAGGGSLFGCWGDNTDSTGWGGDYYAEMLKVVYPRIKSANSNAQVIVGGLLMDCISCNSSAKFLNGILRRNGHNDGKNYFDGVAFHAYDYAIAGVVGQYLNPNWNSEWNDEGPVIIAKAEFLKGVLSNYSASSKFLMNTESAVIDGSSQCTNCDFSDSNRRTTKDYYIAEAYAVSIYEGLAANVWYSLLGWRGSALTDGSLNPTPAYTAYSYAYSQLAGATAFSKLVSNNVFVYKFHRPNNGDIWVVWSKDGSTHSLSLGGTPHAIYDVFGASQSVASSVSVGTKPLYINW